MPRYAQGKWAWGISDRSGFRFRLRDMQTEWTGAKVGPDEFETKHPQLEPKRVFADATALRGPRPDQIEPVTAYVGIPLVEAPRLPPLRLVARISSVEVTTA